jgi:hypothetical protein
MNYAIADGWNNEAGLTPFLLQPKQPNGITYPEQVFGGDLSSGFIGTPKVELVWSNTITRENKSLLLAQADLSLNYGSEVTSNRVTLRILDDDEEWIVVNATIHAPRETERFYIGWNRLILTAMLHGLVS